MPELTSKTELSFESQVVARLGGWPGYFGLAEEQHALAMLAAVIRAKVIDEPVFRVVCFWAGHMAAHDRVAAKIEGEAFKPVENKYLSGLEQQQAFHENKAMKLQRELLATPYARAKAGGSAQTDFLDLFDVPPETELRDAKTVTPFRSMKRRGQG